MSDDEDSSYGLKINSIGDAVPASSAILSDALSCSPELISRAVYTAPSQLFTSLDLQTAQKAHEVLSKLGFDVDITRGTTVDESKKTLFDIAVFLSSPLDLTKVVNELAAFLGLQKAKAQNMLMAYPPLVLGRVTQSTVDALSKRIPEAQVVAFIPHEGSYTARLINVQKTKLSDLYAQQSIQIDDDVFLDGLTFEQTKEIWRQFSNQCQVVHRSLLRAKLLVLNVDRTNPKAIDYLVNHVGMPEDFANDIHSYLPLQLFEPRLLSNLKDEEYQLQMAGIEYELIPLWEDLSNLHLISINQNKIEAIKKILHSFFEGEVTIDANKPNDLQPLHVFSEKPTLLNYFAEELLSEHGCDVIVEPCLKLKINHLKYLDVHENTV